jgi:two-component system OmpR family response regulator
MRLLLVEPYAGLARALRWGLEEEGFAVEAVDDPQAADARVRQEVYDVIVVDLPLDTSRDLLGRWRSGGLRIPVLVLLDPGTETDRRMELREEDCDTFSKPLVLADLLDRVGALLERNGDPHAGRPEAPGRRQSDSIDF